MRIRSVKPRDAAPIASVHVRAWQTAYRGIIDHMYLQELSVADQETGWNKRLADNAILTLLAEEDGNTVGFITGGKSRDAGDPPSDGRNLFRLHFTDFWGPEKESDRPSCNRWSNG